MKIEAVIQDCFFLESSFFVDADHPSIRCVSEKITRGILCDLEKIKKLFEYVREHYVYDLMSLTLKKEKLKASSIIHRKKAFCVEKAILLCALLRSSSIPSRLRFSNVKNHVSTPSIEKVLRTDVFVFHADTEVYYEHQWILLSPAFDKNTCRRMNVDFLEFAHMQEARLDLNTKAGKKHLKYIHQYGSFRDLPYTLYLRELNTFYPHIDFFKFI